MAHPLKTTEPLSRELLSARARSLIKSLEQGRRSRSLPAFEERVRLSREELLDQPVAIEQTLREESDRLRTIALVAAKRGIRKVFCVGCGDSYYSALAMRYVFEQLVRIPFVPIQALEYTRYYHSMTDEKTLVIALSSSGRVPRTTEALLKAKELGALTLGVTNSLNTPFTDEPDEYILVRARRLGGCPTQSSTAAMAALSMFAIELAVAMRTLAGDQERQRRGEVEALPALVERLIAQNDDKARALAEELKDATPYFFVGGGPSLATANFGAAKIKEMSEDLAIVLQLEEYHHYESIKANETLILVNPRGFGNDRALDTAKNARKSHAKVVSLVEEGDQEVGPLSDFTFTFPPMWEALTPIPYVVPLQLFAVHLGAIKPPRA